MIDENMTFAFFGYHSFDWSEGSQKTVIVICDGCGIAKTSSIRNSFRTCLKCRELTEKQKEKLRLTRLKENLSKETREKMSKARMGKKLSQKSKDKVSKAHKGKILTEEHKKKLSKAHMGKKPSLETRMKRSISLSGEKNPAWLGGITQQRYCSKFNEFKKEEIREQYNNCDFISGLHTNIINNGEKLSIHHIDYNKQQGCKDYKWKLIPLSRSNHSKTNHNRWFWNKLFINTLEIDKWYYQ